MSDDKKSWREIDQTRDRGGPRPTQKKSMKAEYAEKRASTAARSDLEKLFSESKVSKEKNKDLEEIKKLRGGPAYYEGLKKFRDTHGMPRDWEVLSLFVDHSDVSLVLEALEEILVWGPKQSADLHKTMKAKLKVVSLSTFEDSVLDKIKEINKKLV